MNEEERKKKKWRGMGEAATQLCSSFRDHSQYDVKQSIACVESFHSIAMLL